MRRRLRSVRTRIFLLVLVPVLSLIGLYAFATSITARDAINLARASTEKNATGEPTGAFVAQLDSERMLAVVYLSDPSGANLAKLELQEAKTSAAAAALRTALTSPTTMNNASVAEEQAITSLLADAARLPSLRSQIAAQIITRARAFATYNTTVGDADLVLNAVIRQQTNAQLVAQALAFVRMGRSEDMLLQENTLLLADLAGRSFPAADLQQFTELVGARRQLLSQTLPDLDPVYRTYYQHDVSPQATAELVTLENAAVRGTRPGSLPAIQPLAWEKAVGAVADGLSAAGAQSADALTVQARSAARGTYLRLVVAGGAGLLAVILSTVMSLLIGRRQVRELAELRESALDLASVRLPDVVARLAAGQPVDIPAGLPDIPHSSNEVGQVRQAFAAVQQTAVEAAVSQAKLRHGISDIFRNLARRSQSLLHRQLAVLDAMERRAGDPHELEDLFRVDHLATRMRRHAESLIILSGEAPARGWRHPVPLVDVVRAAVAEVEDYTRIKVTATTQAALAGPAVGDVIHMVAELAENATIYSPPHTPVSITGSIVGQGFAVEIEDRGLGLSTEHRAEINARLENPPTFDLSGSDQLGLFVAGQLAKRHHIKISLRNSPYGGTTAIVLIPHNLVIAEPDRARDPSAGPTQSAVLMKARRIVRDESKLAGGVAGAGIAGGLAGVGTGRELSPASAQSGTAALAAANWPGSEASLPRWPEAGTTLSDWPISPAGPDTQDEPGTGYQEPGTDFDPEELPRRVRQASLAPQLRDSPARPPSVPDLGALTGRSPEETRVTMSAIQRGWERGRSVFDAAGPSGTASTSPSGTASTSPSGTASTGPDSAADGAHATSPAADTAAGQVSGDGAAAGTHHSDD